MPPKRKGTAHKQAAAAAPPATVTTSRGKEIAPTAATRRERRETVASSPQLAKATAALKKRGRSAAAAATEDDADGDEAKADAEPPKKRGRSAKKPAADQADEAEEEEEKSAPKKRGRPANVKNAKASAKVSAKAAAAAEDDDVDAAPITNSHGNLIRRANTSPEDVSSDEENFDNPPCKYWLMKAEQEDRFETTKDGTEINTRFTIDDLRSKDEPEAWDGVRNAVAAKNMRAMSKGDLAFFYASGGKSGRKPGITGIMEIVSEAEPDPTTADESSYGYVEKAADRKKWVIVKVAFRKKFSKPIGLKTLQTFRHSSGVLENMQLFKQSRLSVSKVSPQEWSWIHQHLVKDSEDDDTTEAAPSKEKTTKKTASVEVLKSGNSREGATEAGGGANGVNAEDA